MNVFSAMDILASGMSAERVRMNTTSSNLANAQTTRTAEGGPYRRRAPVFAAVLADNDPFAGEVARASQAVEVVDVVQDRSAPRQVYDPSHPDANADGYVAMPNIEMVEEMVNLLTASRAYEAGITAMRSLVQMAERTLGLGR